MFISRCNCLALGIILSNSLQNELPWFFIFVWSSSCKMIQSLNRSGKRDNFLLRQILFSWEQLPHRDLMSLKITVLYWKSNFFASWFTRSDIFLSFFERSSPTFKLNLFLALISLIFFKIQSFFLLAKFSATKKGVPIGTATRTSLDDRTDILMFLARMLFSKETSPISCIWTVLLLSTLCFKKDIISPHCIAK